MPNNFSALLSDGSDEEGDAEQPPKELLAHTAGSKKKKGTKKNDAVSGEGGYVVEKNDVVVPPAPALEAFEPIADVGEKPLVEKRSTKTPVKGNKFAALMGDDTCSEDQEENENEEVKAIPLSEKARRPQRSFTSTKTKSQLDRQRKCVQS